MKMSTVIILGLSALGVYLTYLSIKATNSNTQAILGSTPGGNVVQSGGTGKGGRLISETINTNAPTTPNLPPANTSNLLSSFSAAPGYQLAAQPNAVIP
jgi:hypothetical protein